MSPSDEQQVQQILKHIDRIESFMKGRSKRDLVEDLQLEQAVSFSLAQIGEAGGKLSSEYKEQHPEIEWLDIRALRNRIIHDYDGLDFDVIYKIIVVFIPKLKAELQSKGYRLQVVKRVIIKKTVKSRRRKL